MEKIQSLRYLIALNFISPGATVVAFLALGILVLWDKILTKKAKIFQLIQGPLVAVFVGILFYNLTKDSALCGPSLQIIWLVYLFLIHLDSFIGQFSFPNFQVIVRPEIWITAFTIALVASLKHYYVWRLQTNWIRTKE